MKHSILAVLVIGILPMTAMAGGHYDRGNHYHGGGHSNSFFGISLGFSGDDWAGAVSYNSGGYGGHYGGYAGYGYAYPRYYAPYYAPAYVAPPPPAVIYRAPAYRPPPVYYGAPRYYNSGRYYYGR